MSTIIFFGNGTYKIQYSNLISFFISYEEVFNNKPKILIIPYDKRHDYSLRFLMNSNVIYKNYLEKHICGYAGINNKTLTIKEIHNFKNKTIFVLKIKYPIRYFLKYFYRRLSVKYINKGDLFQILDEDKYETRYLNYFNNLITSIPVQGIVNKIIGISDNGMEITIETNKLQHKDYFDKNISKKIKPGMKIQLVNSYIEGKIIGPDKNEAIICFPI